MTHIHVYRYVYVLYMYAWLPVCHMLSSSSIDDLRGWRMRSHAYPHTYIYIIM
ncbi:unnamed protein product [Arabidopsis halleri]